MPARERRKLSDAAIARLRPRAREYTVWDREVPSLGVRVRPTGGKSYVLLCSAAGGSTRIALGPVDIMSAVDARGECLARHTRPEPVGTAAPIAPLLRDFVEGEWMEAHFGRYRPATKTGYRSLLAGRILPAFGSKPLDRIAPARVREWFDDYSRTAPTNANRALKLLRQIMNFAIARGYVQSNPTRGIAQNRRPPLTRFLSREEIARLHRALDGQTGESNRQQADIVRLLLLTGCRKSEIVRLRWSEVQGDMLVLAESKTGPRKVPLNAQAQRILERQPREDSAFVFPSPLDPSRPRSRELSLWHRVRRQVGIQDVRLHDLRHTHASHAVMNGVPVPVVSRLLGHSSVGMTLRYAHLGDREIEQAAERTGLAIDAIMNGHGRP
ncbi:MAG: tyrosine-type recombinase/integrase [Defluviicoccus sp.]|nr:tyrosine-type recombinase/integrase [Defluviicoccus sp.]MDE0274597.1 tyrosine-type recombinase/integrase [Defluviicoccus sp.]